MASSLEFVNYVTDQLSGAGMITWKRMFGEFGLYCDQLFFGTICDDQLFVKITPEVEKLIPDCPQASPYEGAKACFLIENLDDREALAQIVSLTCEHLPKPKPRKAKKENSTQAD